MRTWPAQVQLGMRTLRASDPAALSAAQSNIRAALHRSEQRAAQRIFRFIESDDSGLAAEAESAGPAVVLLKPAGDRCNLACDYCYEALRQRESGKLDIMPLAMMQQIVARALAPGSGVREIYLHGGEPLLAGKAFFRAFIDAVRQARNGNAISIGVQTNGVLVDEEWVRMFRDGGMKVGLSLDGDAALNGLHRKNLGGQPTYREVRRAIDLLHRYRMPFGVISVFSAQIAEIPGAAGRILDHMRELGVTNLDVHPAYTPVETSGAAAVYNVTPALFSHFMSGMFDAWLASDRNGLVVRSFDDVFQLFSGIKSDVCYKSGQCMSIVGVNQDGSMLPCTRPFERQHAFGKEFSQITRHPSFQQFQRAEMAGQEATRNCEWRDFCGNGGCPHERFSRGRQDPGGRHIYCTCDTGGQGGYPALFRHIVDKIMATVGGAHPAAAGTPHCLPAAGQRRIPVASPNDPSST